MIKHKISQIFLVVLVILFSAWVYAQGKSDNAPGKKKQVEVGSVQNVTNAGVLFKQSRGGKSIDTKIDRGTKVVGQDKKLLKLSDIKPKDMVAIVSTGEGELKKVTKVFVKDASSSAQLKRRAVHGIITGINGSLITLAHQIHSERLYSVMFDGNTVFKMKGVSPATSANLAVGQRIAAVGELIQGGGILAKRIHIIPGNAFGVFRKLPPTSPIATGSATPTGEPSATPSASPSISPSVSPSPVESASPSPELSPSPSPVESPSPSP